MKLFTRIFSILTLSVCLILASCGEDKPKKSINALSEGIIEYKAASLDPNHPMASFTPSKANVKFKENQLFVEMYAGLGLLYMAFISNPHEKTLSQLVSITGIKDACIQSEAENLKENEDYQLKFEETKETKMIAGYLCKKVKATMVKDPSISFDIYYTTDLGGDSINNISPYRAIKGMLMDYRLKKLGIEMCFTATAVKKEEIEDSIFKIPAEYKVVSRKELDQIFTELM